MGISKLQVALIGIVAWSAGNVLGQEQQAAGNDRVVSFLAPGRAAQAGALQQLGNQSVPPSGRARVGTGPEERGQPSWGAYLTPSDNDNLSDGPTRVSPLVLDDVPCMPALCVTCRLSAGSWVLGFLRNHTLSSRELALQAFCLPDMFEGLAGKCDCDTVSARETEFQRHPQ